MRITNEHLQNLVTMINKAANKPMDYLDDSGNIAIGHYHISRAYGGCKLVQTVTASGGERDILTAGHISKRDCYDHMHAYLKGIEFTQEGKL